MLYKVRLALEGAEWGSLVLGDDLVPLPRTFGHIARQPMRRMTEFNFDEIPMVAQDDFRRLVGLLSRRELTLAYTSLIESLRSPGGNARRSSQSGDTTRSN